MCCRSYLVSRNDLPSFGTLLRSELRVGLERGFSRVIPWLLVACSAVGYAAAHFADPRVFSQQNWSTLAAVYGGVVTFNGKPLADATVSFASTASEKGHLPGIGSTATGSFMSQVKFWGMVTSFELRTCSHETSLPV